MRDSVNEDAELARSLPLAPHPAPPVNETVRILKEARALIADEGHWCGTGPGDEVITFCAALAIKRAAGFPKTGRVCAYPKEHRLWKDGCIALHECLPSQSLAVPQFNDDPTTTHADVLALFDRAIERAQQEAA